MSDFSKYYRQLSLLTTSVIVILLMLNILSYLILISGLNLEKRSSDPFYFKPEEKYFQKEAYFGTHTSLTVDESYFHAVYSDAMNYYQSKENPPFRYEPAVENVQSPYSSSTLNIIKNSGTFPYRVSYEDEKELKVTDGKSIVCFGGSTTFGSFVSDQHTWPGFLYSGFLEDETSAIADVKNFGCSWHVVSQETSSFLKLLKLGHEPSIVIFMDGVNLGLPFDGSEFAPHLARGFRYTSTGTADFKMLLTYLPVIKLIARIKGQPHPVFDESAYFENTEQFIQIISNRFVENAKIRQALADLYDVEIIQFLQPNPFIGYDERHLLPNQVEMMESEDGKRVKHYFSEVYEKVLEADVGYHDLSKLWLEYDHPVLVDGIHYSPDFNKFLADEVRSYITADSLENYTFNPQSVTGTVFQ